MAKAEPTSHWDKVAAAARDAGTRVAFGTDLLFSPDTTDLQSDLFVRFGQVFGNAGTLMIGTSGNADLMQMSGERNAYKDAALGVLKPGAWADMLLVDGDPTQDLAVLTDHGRNLAMIMKNGKLYKDTLPA